VHLNADGSMVMESDSDTDMVASHNMHVNADGSMVTESDSDTGSDTGMEAGHAMTNGAEEPMAMGGGASVTLVATEPNARASMQVNQSMVLGPAPLTLDLLTGSSGLPMHYSTLVEGLGVVESSLFDLNGEIVWSTNPASVGRSYIEESLIRSAAAGAVSSKLIKDSDVVGMDGSVQNMDVVSTYVPLQDSPSSPVVGVLEINREVGTELGPWLMKPNRPCCGPQ
jgi:hypothetical protein